VALLLGNGESLCGNVSDDPGFPATGSPREHRKFVRTGNTTLFHDQHVSALQHPAAAIGLLEVPHSCHVSERVSSVEGTHAEFGRGAATRARGAESLSKGDARGDREVR